MGRSGGSSRHVELELKFDVPADLAADIDDVNAWVYPLINNGV